MLQGQLCLGLVPGRNLIDMCLCLCCGVEKHPVLQGRYYSRLLSSQPFQSSHLLVLQGRKLSVLQSRQLPVLQGRRHRVLQSRQLRVLQSRKRPVLQSRQRPVLQGRYCSRLLARQPSPSPSNPFVFWCCRMDNCLCCRVDSCLCFRADILCGWRYSLNEQRFIYHKLPLLSHIRPYYPDSTVSRPICEVKQGQVRLVLAWGTSWEVRMLYISFCYFFSHFFAWLFFKNFHPHGSRLSLPWDLCCPMHIVVQPDISSLERLRVWSSRS